MKTQYKGYEIEVKREKCLGGWSNLYYSVYRIADGLEVICAFTTGEDTVGDFVKYMKASVDEFIETKGASEDLEDEFQVVQ